MPYSAALPVPTMIAVGVARPSAHGQAMISTAIAACKREREARLRPLIQHHPADKGQRRQDQDGGYEHFGDAVGQALHGRLRALGFLDQPHDLRERGVLADLGGPEDEAAGLVQRGANDLLARALFNGQ